MLFLFPIVPVTQVLSRAHRTSNAGTLPCCHEGLLASRARSVTPHSLTPLACYQAPRHPQSWPSGSGQQGTSTAGQGHFRVCLHKPTEATAGVTRNRWQRPACRFSWASPSSGRLRAFPWGQGPPSHPARRVRHPACEGPSRPAPGRLGGRHRLREGRRRSPTGALGAPLPFQRPWSRPGRQAGTREAPGARPTLLTVAPVRRRERRPASPPPAAGHCSASSSPQSPGQRLPPRRPGAPRGAACSDRTRGYAVAVKETPRTVSQAVTRWGLDRGAPIVVWKRKRSWSRCYLKHKASLSPHGAFQSSAPEEGACDVVLTSWDSGLRHRSACSRENCPGGVTAWAANPSLQKLTRWKVKCLFKSQTCWYTSSHLANRSATALKDRMLKTMSLCLIHSEKNLPIHTSSQFSNSYR